MRNREQARSHSGIRFLSRCASRVTRHHICRCEKMQVILLEAVENLGKLGDTVKVKPGYARNYLLPQGKAMPATKENLAEVEALLLPDVRTLLVGVRPQHGVVGEEARGLQARRR